MDLKEKLVSSFLAFENSVDVDHPVHEIRSEAIKKFETKGFPSKKEEAWKYTNLERFLGASFPEGSRSDFFGTRKEEALIVDDQNMSRMSFFCSSLRISSNDFSHVWLLSSPQISVVKK